MILPIAYFSNTVANFFHFHFKSRGKNYLAIIRSRSVNKFLFSVTYEADSKPNMIKYLRFLSYY